MEALWREPTINLDHLSVDDLVALSTRLDAQLKAARKTQTALAEVVDQIHARFDAIGVTVQDVIAALQAPKRGAAKGKTAKGSTVA